MSLEYKEGIGARETPREAFVAQFRAARATPLPPPPSANAADAADAAVAADAGQGRGGALDSAAADAIRCLCGRGGPAVAPGVSARVAIDAAAAVPPPPALPGAVVSKKERKRLAKAAKKREAKAAKAKAVSAAGVVP